jgi:recombination DNA repair RAD52 pathway protein
MRRRTRSRYYTIDAENEEDFIKEYENMRKSRLTELEFDNKEENEKIQETDEEELLSPRKNRGSISYNNLEDEGEYSGLGAMKDLDDEEEDDLAQHYEDDEILKKSEDDIIKDNNEEKGLEVLCYYLKNSITEQSK